MEALSLLHSSKEVVAFVWLDGGIFLSVAVIGGSFFNENPACCLVDDLPRNSGIRILPCSHSTWLDNANGSIDA
jgi:hypothetical protein